MKAIFTVLGEPRGKGRPRVMKRGNFVHTYTPDATVSYENLIKTEYHLQCPGKFYAQKVPVTVKLNAYYGIPNSVSNKRKKEMIAGFIRPTKKVDADNLVKVFMDALNGVAFYDDVQVVDLEVHKLYDENPRVVVIIEDIEEEP